LGRRHYRAALAPATHIPETLAKRALCGKFEPKKNPVRRVAMKAMFAGFAVAIVIAIGAHFVLDSVQTSTADRYSVPTSVRL
jgi:hypothetical protein